MGSVQEITINKGQQLMEQRDRFSYRWSLHQLHKQPGKEMVFSVLHTEGKVFCYPHLQGREKTDRYLPPHPIPFTHAPKIAFTSRATGNRLIVILTV